MRKFATALLPFASVLALAACGAEPEEATYETDVVDESGGELIVTEEDPAAIPVDTPDSEMTPVPDEEIMMEESAPPANGAVATGEVE